MYLCTGLAFCDGRHGDFWDRDGAAQEFYAEPDGPHWEDREECTQTYERYTVDIEHTSHNVYQPAYADEDGEKTEGGAYTA